MSSLKLTVSHSGPSGRLLTRTRVNKQLILNNLNVVAPMDPRMITMNNSRSLMSNNTMDSSRYVWLNSLNGFEPKNLNYDYLPAGVLKTN